MPSQLIDLSGKVENTGATAIGTGSTAQAQVAFPQIDSTGNIQYAYNGQTIDTSVEKVRGMDLQFIDSPAILLVASATDGSLKYITNKFLLQGITKPRMERFQIVETFGESKLFFFGERTKVYSLNGVLIEALDSNYEEIDFGFSWPTPDKSILKATQNQFRWSTALQTLYDQHLRGTKLAQQGNIAILYVDKLMLQGYPVQLQITRDSNNPALVQFQMTWVIYKEDYLDPVGITDLFSLTPRDPALAQRLRAAQNAYKQALDAKLEAEKVATDAIAANPGTEQSRILSEKAIAAREKSTLAFQNLVAVTNEINNQKS